MRNTENYEKEIGIAVDVDELVYSAILFAEGGKADARTIRSRSATFLNDELYELFRLISSESTASDLVFLQKIKISVQLPKSEKTIRSLFKPNDAMNILLFSSKRVANMCNINLKDKKIYNAQSIKSAKSIIQKNDIQVVIIDIDYGKSTPSQNYLNKEDIESKARDFLLFLRENYSDVPVYLLQTSKSVMSFEEKISFLKSGVRDVIYLFDESNSINDTLANICNELHQQNSMHYLAKSNKVISYETAQSISKNGKEAEIKLFDFKMQTAIDADDSKNILDNVSKPNVHFDDIIGAEDAKKELKFFVEYLKNPKKFRGTGLKAPKGVLLYGPPGTGKTMLAKAMACESDVTFITAEGNQFLQKWLGEGKKMAHELFQTARKYAPSILFVDEIESFAKERRGGEHPTANGEDVLAAFLTEMDGFHCDPSKPVFVLAATNFDVEPGHDRSLDKALLRRFDRNVYIDLPGRDERIKYINLKLNANKAFSVSQSEIDNIAIRSTGMSLAEIEAFMELALRSAVREGKCKVTDSIFEEAFETYNSGETKHWDVNLLKRVARHEAGHAFLCWYSGKPPAYVTIVARGKHGGYMQHDDNEGKALYTKEEMLSKIRTSLGGRASEIVYYGKTDGISTGASGDLATATRLAQQMMCTYGMDEKFGLSVIDNKSTQSNELSAEIRNAVNTILNEQMEQAINIISENKHIMDMFVEELMSKNHMSGDEIKLLLEQK